MVKNEIRQQQLARSTTVVYVNQTARWSRKKSRAIAALCVENLATKTEGRAATARHLQNRADQHKAAWRIQ